MNRSKKIQDRAISTYINAVPGRIRKHTDKIISPSKKVAKASGLFVGNRSEKGKQTVRKIAERITFGKISKKKKRKRRKKRK